MPPDARPDLIDSYGFFLAPREMVLCYLQPGADDDHRTGSAPPELALGTIPAHVAALSELCTDAAGRQHGTSAFRRR